MVVSVWLTLIHNCLDLVIIHLQTFLNHPVSKEVTTTYRAFLRRAKQKTGRVCEAKTTCHIYDVTRIAPCGSPTIANL